MAHVTAIVLALISGVLISSDLIISKDTAISINKTLHRLLTLSIPSKEDLYWGPYLSTPGRKDMKKTFMVSAILAVVGVAGWITYAVLKDLHSGSPTNIWWLGIFAGGFILGLAMQWFSIQILRKWVDEFYAILFSSLWLIILGVIIFASTVHNIHAVQFILGMLYGICMIEFSILATKLFTWFWTTDPNPEPGSNPRVLARIGLSFAIVAGIIELIISLT